MPRRYMPADKREAVELSDQFVAQGKTVEATAKELGIPSGTLRAWRSQADRDPRGMEMDPDRTAAIDLLVTDFRLLGRARRAEVFDRPEWHRPGHILALDIVRMSPSPADAASDAIRQAASGMESRPGLLLYLGIGDEGSWTFAPNRREAAASAINEKRGTFDNNLEYRLRRLADRLLTLNEDWLEKRDFIPPRPEVGNLLHIDYDEFTKLALELASRLLAYEGLLLIGVARGGLAVTSWLDHYLGLRQTGVVQAWKYRSDLPGAPSEERAVVEGGYIPDGEWKTIAIVDDIVDTVHTMEAAADFVLRTLRDRGGGPVDLVQASLVRRADTPRPSSLWLTAEWAKTVIDGGWAVYPWEVRPLATQRGSGTEPAALFTKLFDGSDGRLAAAQ